MNEPDAVAALHRLRLRDCLRGDETSRFGALVLLIAVPVLAWSAERIVEESDMTATFIGTSLVA